MDLAHLFAQYGSDKQQRHFLADFYTELTDRSRDRPGALAEIGLWIPTVQAWQGGSLRAWADWLPLFTIVGVDNDPDAIAATHIFTPRAHTILADQSNPADMAAALLTHAAAYDLIIDDGSHSPAHQAACFSELFQLLRPGGQYVIEDLLVHPADPPDFFDLLTQLAHVQITRVARHFEPPAMDIHFHADACAIRRLA